MDAELTGAFPALVTPLHDPATVDLEGLSTVVKLALDDGAAGVLVAGSTGEGTLLTPEQRVAVTRQARAVLGAHEPRGPLLFAGASAPTIDELFADVARLAAAGADAVLVMPPGIQPLRPEEVVDAQLAVAERADVPTLVYHVPQFTNSPLTTDGVRELATAPGIAGMKDSSPDAERRARFVEVAAEKPGFVVLTGHAQTLGAALEAGAAGSITAVANLRMRQIVALHAAAADGDTQRIAELQRSLVHLSDGIARVGASVPAVCKAVLQLGSVIAERWCRPPLRSVAPAALDRVRTVVLP